MSFIALVVIILLSFVYWRAIASLLLAGLLCLVALGIATVVSIAASGQPPGLG